jgi:hypothetical protein
MRVNEKSPILAKFADELLPKIEEDFAILNQICANPERSEVTFKDVSAWIAEKLSRAKLRLADEPALGAFESLEMLSLGILGKLKLWQVLDLLSADVTQLAGFDFKRLIERASVQHECVETLRLQVAQQTFLSADS